MRISQIRHMRVLCNVYKTIHVEDIIMVVIMLKYLPTMVNFTFDTNVLRGLSQNSLNNTHPTLPLSRSLGEATKLSSEEVSVIGGKG